MIDTVRSWLVLALTWLLLSLGSVFAADYDAVQRWTAGLASHIERDLRKSLDQPDYADQLVGLDKDSVAEQISRLLAACLVKAYVRVAEAHSIEPEDIFVTPEAGLIRFELLPDEAMTKETANCPRDAFTATGIDYE